jgi:mannose-6-phosphate isomerase-like protein (cupin superfamily)
MLVISKSERVPFTNSPTCSGLEYQFGDKNLNIAIVTVDGRYPETGLLTNDVCTEIAYVLDGTGVVTVGNEARKLAADDAVLIQPGEKFAWQGTKLRMLMPCSPAFYPEQHRQAI